MDKTCYMIKCNNTNNLSDRQFYQFPSDLNLCRKWVEICGDPQLLEDLTHGGVESLLTKTVCSWHFSLHDYIDSQLERLKPNAVPKFLECHFIKTESDDFTQVSYALIKKEGLDEHGCSTNSNGDTVCIKNEDLDQDDSVTKFNASACTFQCQTPLPVQDVLMVDCSSSYETNNYVQTQEDEEGFEIVEDIPPETIVALPPANVPTCKSTVKKKTSSEPSLKKHESNQDMFTNITEEQLPLGNLKGNQIRKRIADSYITNIKFDGEFVGESQNLSDLNEEKTVEKVRRIKKKKGHRYTRKYRRLRNQKTRLKRSLETDEERTARRLKDKINSANRRKRETDEEKEVRRKKERIRAAERRKRRAELKPKNQYFTTDS